MLLIPLAVLVLPLPFWCAASFPPTAVGLLPPPPLLPFCLVWLLPLLCAPLVLLLSVVLGTEPGLSLIHI